MERIVSLLPSSTEIICALGLQDRLVGRSHECDYPPSISHLPVCTQPKAPGDGTSYQIHERVQAILAEALSVYRVDSDLLNRLRPTHVVTQVQCEVCAVSLKDVEQALLELTDSRPEIIALRPDSLAQIWEDFMRVARTLDVAARGEAVLTDIRARMTRVREKAQALPVRPRVACIEWIDPLMAAGNWMPELVEMAGGVNLFGEAGRHSAWMEWGDLRRADPDVLAILPCGFDLKRTRSELPHLTRLPGWADLKAVREARVVLMDGSHYFNRPGPRLAESLEILAEALHPGALTYGHRGEGWEPF